MRGKGAVVFKVVLLAAALTVASGCMTKINELQGANQQLVAQREALDKEIADLRDKQALHDQEVGDLDAQIKKLETDLDYAKSKAEEYEAAYNEIKDLGVSPGFAESFLQKLAAEMGGEYIEGGGVRLSSDLLFDSGKATLKTQAITAMKAAANAFQQREAEGLHLRIDGHTDSDPIKASAALWKDNMDLSQARARAVWLEIKKGGIAPERMFTAGFGEYVPISDNATRQGKSNNRRVEIWLVPPPAASAVK